MSSATSRLPPDHLRASSVQGHRQLLNPPPISSPRSASQPQPTRQEEKTAVTASYAVAVGREISPAERIGQDPRHKRLGLSSQKLRVEDFELMKTLGTGKEIGH